MKKTITLFSILFILCSVDAFSQPWYYDFGTAVDSLKSGISTTFLPTPPSGTARVRVGSGAGRFDLMNPGYLYSGNGGSELRIQAPIGTSVNKFSIYEFTGGKSFSMRFRIGFGSQTLAGDSANSGEFYIITGNGTRFSDNNGFQGSQTFLGLKITFSDDTVQIVNRDSNIWSGTIPGPIYQGNDDVIHIYCNNSTANDTFNFYGRRIIEPNKTMLFVNHQYDNPIILDKAELPNDTNINSFMIYGASSTGNEAHFFVDEIYYTNEIADNPLGTFSASILPQFMTTGTNRMMTPFFATLSHLDASTTYRYYVKGVNERDQDNDGAGGNIIPNHSTQKFERKTSVDMSSNYFQFTTDASGSYSGWFILEQNSDTTFDQNEDVYMRILLNDGAGGSSIDSRHTLTTPVTVLDYGTTSGNSEQCSFFWGNSAYYGAAGAPGNIVLAYSKVDGSNRPLSSGVIESDGLNLTAVTDYLAGWRNNVDTNDYYWGLIIPNDLDSGVRRLEEREVFALPEAPGDFVKFNSDEDGVWNGTVDTRNPNVGTGTTLQFEGPLDVDITNFTAVTDRNNVTLSWQTTWEENNDRFEVLRRVHAVGDAEWTKVGVVKGAGTTNTVTSYSFTDKNLTTGRYEYKLVQYDLNGNSSADFELGSYVEIGVPEKFDLSQNYPNPFNPTTKIDFQIPVEVMTKLVIFDLSGREVATLVNETLMPGYYTYDFNASTLASGVYVYRLVSNDNIQTKRMVLIK